MEEVPVLLLLPPARAGKAEPVEGHPGPRGALVEGGEAGRGDGGQAGAAKGWEGVTGHCTGLQGVGGGHRGHPRPPGHPVSVTSPPDGHAACHTHH